MTGVYRCRRALNADSERSPDNVSGISCQIILDVEMNVFCAFHFRHLIRIRLRGHGNSLLSLFLVSRFLSVSIRTTRTMFTTTETPRMIFIFSIHNGGIPPPKSIFLTLRPMIKN